MRISILSLSAALAASAVPSQHTLHQFGGAVSQDKFGYAVNTAGDLDGDGFDEFIVGAVFADNNGNRSGTATVFDGATGAVRFQWDGNAVGDEFGYSVGPAGDVNADGQPDFVIGAIGPYDNNGPFNGGAFVYSGDDGRILYAFHGDTAYDFHGLSVRGGGDVNADGYDDVVVGIPGNDDNGSASGSVRVYSGRDGSVLYEFDGDGPGDQFGWWVAVAGDVDADGFSDIVAGAPRPNGFVPGYVRVLSGRDGSWLHTFRGQSGGDEFGWCVDFAGDVDRDGHDDVIVGAHLDDGNGVDAGSVTVFSGRTGAVLHTWDGDAAGDELGWSVAGAGDVDGDGAPDLIGGAHLADVGAADTGYARVWSGATGAALTTVAGDSADDQMGFAVGSAGDVDADGYVDVIVGAIFDEISGTDTGSARVISLGFGGTPPRAQIEGAGCPGSDGRQPRIGARGRAALGESYRVLLRGARPNASVFLNIGTSWSLSLDPVAPGCVAQAYPVLAAGTTADADGLAALVPSFAPLPVIPALIGVRLSHQWIALDGPNNLLGISISDVLRTTIGS